jgi:hypothetical protein
MILSFCGYLSVYTNFLPMVSFTVETSRAFFTHLNNYCLHIWIRGSNKQMQMQQLRNQNHFWAHADLVCGSQAPRVPIAAYQFIEVFVEVMQTGYFWTYVNHINFANHSYNCKTNWAFFRENKSVQCCTDLILLNLIDHLMGWIHRTCILAGL